MDIDIVTSQATSRLHVRTTGKTPALSTFADDVRAGLSAEPKTLAPRYFYDEAGSELFEAICDLPEYYPTDCEREIIRDNMAEITDTLGTNTCIVELGSGSSVKTELILKAFLDMNGGLEYVPIDISKPMLVQSSKQLLLKYNKLHITALAADYHTALDYLRTEKTGRKLILFLGSSIGNFTAAEQIEFLSGVRDDMAEEDRLLIGIDLMKDQRILEPAYNDAQGVTARFNLNLLTRINRELGADFNLSSFRHRAHLNKDKHRIEMHLESLGEQTVTIASLNSQFHFSETETIHTENSYKFSKQQILDLAFDSGFRVETTWFDNRGWFSLNLFRPLR